MEHSDRVKALMLAMGNALDNAKISYDMLLDELAADLGVDDGSVNGGGVDVVDPAPLRASEDAALCQHPHFLEVLGQHLCETCGTNISE